MRSALWHCTAHAYCRMMRTKSWLVLGLLLQWVDYNTDLWKTKYCWLMLNMHVERNHSNYTIREWKKKKPNKQTKTHTHTHTHKNTVFSELLKTILNYIKLLKSQKLHRYVLGKSRLLCTETFKGCMHILTLHIDY
jgi:hypothetical protein